MPFLAPCPFRQLTGLLCPGCGATHAVLALLHGNLARAWHDNPLLIALLPFVLAYFVLAASRSLRAHPRPWPPIPTPLTNALLLTAVAFAVLRNL